MIDCWPWRDSRSLVQLLVPSDRCTDGHILQDIQTLTDYLTSCLLSPHQSAQLANSCQYWRFRKRSSWRTSGSRLLFPPNGHHLIAIVLSDAAATAPFPPRGRIKRCTASVRLFVCHVACLRFTRNKKVVETSNSVEIGHWTWVTGEQTLV